MKEGVSERDQGSERQREKDYKKGNNLIADSSLFAHLDQYFFYTA